MTDWRDDDEAQALIDAIEGIEPWRPMRQVDPDPATMQQLASFAKALGGSGETHVNEVWTNGEYEVFVRYMEERGRPGALHLSIKRYDRAPARDWRHLQSIKNEVCGWGREGLELFPAEARLVDQANQTHLWVMPAGVVLEIGFMERLVKTEEEARDAVRGFLGDDAAKGRQRPWQPGISTGPNYKP